MGFPLAFVVGTYLREGESLPGYIVRFAERAGFDQTGRLAAVCGLRQPGSATASSNYERFASFAAINVPEILAASYRPTERFAHHQFLGGELHREMLDIARRRVCPMCIATRAHHRAIWDVALITACSEHRIRLTDRCPKCRRQLGWHHPSICLCACGSDIRTWVCQPVAMEEARAADDVGRLASGRNSKWLPEALRLCATADLIRLAMCMGMFLTGWGRERRIETLSAAGADAVARVTVAGMQALRQWPTSLQAFLHEEQQRASARPGRYGARKSLGPFYTWLRDVEPDAVRRAVLDVAQVVVQRDPVLARRVHRSELLANAVAPLTVIGLVEAAKVLGKSQTTVKGLMASGKLPMAISEGRGVPMTLDRIVVEEAAANLSSMLTLEQLAVRLNVSKARTRALVAAGYLAEAHHARGPRAFDRNAVDDWLASLEQGRTHDRKAPAVSFEFVARAFLRRGMDFPVLLESVISGRLPVAALDLNARGLKRLMFSKANVQAVGEETRTGSVLTIQAVAQRLGIKWEVASHLLKRGFLEASGSGISELSVHAFSDNFVSGAALARSRSTSSRALAAALAKAQVTPVTGPGVDDGRQTFYSCADLKPTDESLEDTVGGDDDRPGLRPTVRLQ